MAEEERYRIVDPSSGREHLLSRMDLWRLTFGAAGSYCHEITRGRVGEEKRKVFAQCMIRLAFGFPTESKAQDVVNRANFPVDEYIERLEIRRAARRLPYYPKPEIVRLTMESAV